jgi:hypothetical protein
VRAFRIHLLIIGHIKKAMPAVFGKDKAARKMLQQLPDVFYQARRGAGCGGAALLDCSGHGALCVGRAGGQGGGLCVRGATREQRALPAAASSPLGCCPAPAAARRRGRALWHCSTDHHA